MKFLLLVICFLTFFLCPKSSFAIEDPLSKPNNKMGVHILFTSELNKAAELINSSGGDWGYVTIPIQAGDRDIEKWQGFMDGARKHHAIPLIRLAIEGDYFNTSVWRKPTREDVLDFANFLNSLDWPTKNRYVIVFNEVNRGDEWQGSPNPQEYANILNFSVDTFKSLSSDFFIISAGMDNAAANVSGKSQNQYDYMTQMNQEVPGIFDKIDGLGSHSYPNPAFSQPPWSKTNMSISSFEHERRLTMELSGKNLPIFITETGWSTEKLSKSQIGSYFSYAFESVWSDSGIVAVTPFLLSAGVEPFLQFSLLDGGSYNDISLSLQRISKIGGQPTLNPEAKSSTVLLQKNNLPAKTFPKKVQYADRSEESTRIIASFLKWLLKLSG